MINFDKLIGAGHMLKFVNYSQATSAVDFNKIKVDMNDPEHWDYPLYKED
jgi:hypothetical protein